VVTAASGARTFALGARLVWLRRARRRSEAGTERAGETATDESGRATAPRRVSARDTTCSAPTKHSVRVEWFRREAGGFTIFVMPAAGDGAAPQPVAERDDDATATHG
jgi:hypothetical protein